MSILVKANKNFILSGNVLGNKKNITKHMKVNLEDIFKQQKKSLI